MNESDRGTLAGLARRTALRAPVWLDCEVKTGGSAWRRLHLRDLSTRGCQVVSPHGAPPGTPVYLRIPGLQLLAGEVRWASEEAIGCEFAAPLSPYVVDHILGQAGR